MGAKVRTISPQSMTRNPVTRYAAGCIECNWHGKKFRAVGSAVNEGTRHDLAKHPGLYYQPPKGDDA